MNELAKILIVGACGAAASLLVQAGAHAVNPKPIVHYWAPEPANTPEEIAQLREAEAKAKLARSAANRAFVGRCLANSNHASIFIADNGAVACSWIGMPPEEWLDK